MKVVIAGSSGLVASLVTRAALSQTSHTLVLVDKVPPKEKISDSRVEYRTLDLLDYDSYLSALKGADALIHLAGFAGNNDGVPLATIHNTNVCLSYNALQAAAEAGLNKVVLGSSVNAIGGVWSEHDPIYLYFPLDEQHPCHHSDPYSLSKRIGEVQADSIARANPRMTISSLRFHAVIPKDCDVSWALDKTRSIKDLWGYTTPESAARACLLAVEPEWTGHEVFFIVADDHREGEEDAQELVERWYPKAEIRGGRMRREQGMYSVEKAERLLGWKPVGGKQLSKG